MASAPCNDLTASAVRISLSSMTIIVRCTWFSAWNHVPLQCLIAYVLLLQQKNSPADLWLHLCIFKAASTLVGATPPHHGINLSVFQAWNWNPIANCEMGMKEKERQNVECGSGHVLGSARVVQFWGFLWCEILGGWEGHRWDKRGKQFPSVILSLKAVWLPLESYVHFYFLRCNSLNSIIIRQQLLHSWKEKKKKSKYTSVC